MADIDIEQLPCAPCAPCGRRAGEAIKVTASTVLFDVGQRIGYLAWIGPTMCVFAVYADF